jgi:parallel beta-helix repeat protein
VYGSLTATCNSFIIVAKQATVKTEFIPYWHHFAINQNPGKPKNPTTMKRLLLLLSIVSVALAANATNYYVSATGNDAAAGTSSATAWKTISKVNAFTFAANDSILFKRGDVFLGGITVKRNNLSYGAYGTGNRPVITGFVTLSGWTLVSTGIYKASVATKSYVNMVALNGRPQQIGRYPNATDANKGYLAFEAAGTNSITDNEMTATVNWTGAEIAIRKNGWRIERSLITNHTGGTFTYRTLMRANGAGAGNSSTAKLGHGYFIQDDIRTLDQFGEWYYDTTARMMNMYFGTNAPTGYNVQVSTVDTLLNMNSKTYISVNDINFEGANLSGVYSTLASNITVKDCDFTNIGSRAIHIYSSGFVTIDNVKVTNCLSNSIQAICNAKTNVTVKNCVVKNNGQIAGMGSFFDDSDYKGMYVGVSTGGLIENNIVDTVGAAGIQFNGSDFVIQKNYVNYFCNVTHDNGGIYTYANGTDAAPGSIYTNRLVSKNVISNGISAPEGTNSASPFCAGIYLDGRTMNVTVVGNTVFNSSKNGIHCNNPANVTIRDNTFFNNLQDISFMRWSWGSITNLNIKKNISFPYTNTQRNIYYINGALNSPTPTTLQSNLQSLGVIDSNYYNTYTDASILTEIYATDGGAVVPTSPFSLGGWRALTGHDQKSSKPKPVIAPYTVNTVVGANIFTNTGFTSNITGVTLFGASTTAAWDNSNKISGGSVRMDFAAPTANRYSFIYGTVGSVNSAKQYVLRFKTLGTSANGIVRAYIRKSASPFNNLVPTQSKAFGLAKIQHEFLINAPTTEAAASFVIEVEQMSGTTYIDDIEFYEVTATLNTIASQVRFEYNSSSVVKTIALGAKYADVDSTIYNGSVTLQPFSSKVFIRVGPIDVLPVCLAGLDKTVFLPIDTVFLAGSATGINITSFAWRKLTGPAQFTINAPNSATTTVSNLVVGTYTFELLVTDASGLTDRDTLSVNVSTILPVKLTQFTAYRQGSKVNLKWVTESEVNSSHYIVERSTNGRDFIAIGMVASNNQAGENVYTLVDNNPAAGVNYYRLAMVDNDNSKTYSRLVSVNMNSRQSFRVETAVVNTRGISVNINSERRQMLTVVAVDAAGRVVMSKQVQLQQGTNTISTDITSIPKMVYYIKMFTDEEAVIKTVLSE